MLKLNSYVRIICHNDDLSLTWLDCLQIDSEGFILFAEIKKILFTISFIPILLTLFLPGEGGISPLIVYHVTKSVRNRVKIIEYACGVL